MDTFWRSSLATVLYSSSTTQHRLARLVDITIAPRDELRPKYEKNRIEAERDIFQQRHLTFPLMDGGRGRLFVKSTNNRRRTETIHAEHSETTPQSEEDSEPVKYRRHDG